MRPAQPARHALILASAIAIASAVPGFVPAAAAAAQAEEFAVFQADIEGDVISGIGFEGDVTVTLTDRTTSPPTVGVYDEGAIRYDDAGGFRLFLDSAEQAVPWDVRPGDVIDVAGPTWTRTTVVADLRITGFDLGLDTLRGTSSAPGRVSLRAGHAGVEAFTSAEVVGGAWTGDFRTADPSYDLRVLDTAEASQPDADGDLTVTRVSALAGPRFAFAPELQQVVGYGWPEGAGVALTVDRPGTPRAPDYRATATAASDRFPGTVLSTGDGNVSFSLAGGPFVILPGDTVTMTDGTTTKSQVIPDLRVALPDEDAGTLTGSTTPPIPAGSFLVVGQDAPGVGGATYEVTPAVDGVWSRAFVSDGGFGSTGERRPWANQVDADGDSTGVNAPVPMVAVDPVRDRVWAADFAAGPVTLTVSRNGVRVDLRTVTTRSIYHDLCPSYDMWTRPVGTLERPTMALFDLAGQVDLRPGDLVAVTDGITLIEVTVDRITVDEANPVTDVMSGTADAPVTITLGDGCGGYWGLQATPVDGAWSTWFDPAMFEVAPDGLAPGSVAWVTSGSGTTRVRLVVGPGPVFGGFEGSVQGPPVVNTLKAGDAVEVRFSLGGDFGPDVLAAGSPTFERIPPVAGPRHDVTSAVGASAAGAVAAGAPASGLRYDPAAGQYVYTWTTERSWVGMHRELVLTFVDGSEARAVFLLTK